MANCANNPTNWSSEIPPPPPPPPPATPVHSGANASTLRQSNSQSVRRRPGTQLHQVRAKQEGRRGVTGGGERHCGALRPCPARAAGGCRRRGPRRRAPTLTARAAARELRGGDGGGWPLANDRVHRAAPGRRRLLGGNAKPPPPSGLLPMQCSQPRHPAASTPAPCDERDADFHSKDPKLHSYVQFQSPNHKDNALAHRRHVDMSTKSSSAHGYWRRPDTARCPARHHLCTSATAFPV